MDNTKMLQIDPSGKTASDMHQLLVGTVAPRPIALVSSINSEGLVNLAPYSYFNAFSSKPPILVFSAGLRGSDASAKDTLNNVRETGEVVINVVCHAMVRQMAITSVQFPAEVDEFSKSGFTTVKSTIVQPPRVAESPVHFECEVRDIIPMGDQGGAGNLVICEAKVIHIAQGVLDDKGRIDPHLMDLMGRMGRAFYTRASGESIQRIYVAGHVMPLGFDGLPASAKKSTVLTGNDLGQLAAMAKAPAQEDIEKERQKAPIRAILASSTPIIGLHEKAKGLLTENQLEEAARLVWLADRL